MIKKFENYIKEDNELKGKRIQLIQMGNDPNPIEPGTKGTVQFVDGIGQIHVKWDNGRTLAIVPEEDKYEIITEGSETVASPGSGTAVGGGAEGSFTSAAGVAVGGGDSGSAFQTNSNIQGMGDIVSPQPSSIPGDVAGSTKGSGDIGQPLGTFTKLAAKKKKKKKKKKKDKRKRKYNKTGANIDNFYVTKYTEKIDNGKLITNWETFNESINNIIFGDYYGVDLEEKGSFGQDLTDVYVARKNEDFYKIGQLRTLGDSPIFYTAHTNIEHGNLSVHTLDELINLRKLSNTLTNEVISVLKKSKKFGSLMDDPISYFDIVQDKLEKND